MSGPSSARQLGINRVVIERSRRRESPLIERSHHKARALSLFRPFTLNFGNSKMACSPMLIDVQNTNENQ